MEHPLSGEEVEYKNLEAQTTPSGKKGTGSEEINVEFMLNLYVMAEDYLYLYFAETITIHIEHKIPLNLKVDLIHRLCQMCNKGGLNKNCMEHRHCNLIFSITYIFAYIKDCTFNINC